MEIRENAGYTITDSVHIGSAEFVIGEKKTQYGTMYVTWQCRDGDNYFWGHYLNSRQEAERDLIDRAHNQLARTLDCRDERKGRER